MVANQKFFSKIEKCLRKSTIVPLEKHKCTQVRRDSYLRKTDSYLSEIRVANKSFLFKKLAI